MADTMKSKVKKTELSPGSPVQELAGSYMREGRPATTKSWLVSSQIHKNVITTKAHNFICLGYCWIPRAEASTSPGTYQARGKQ